MKKVISNFQRPVLLAFQVTSFNFHAPIPLHSFLNIREIREKKWYNLPFYRAVLPHLDYCAVVWANCTTELQQGLQKFHNYGMRIILQARTRSASSMLRAKLRWMTLEQRRTL